MMLQAALYLLTTRLHSHLSQSDLDEPYPMSQQLNLELVSALGEAQHQLTSVKLVASAAARAAETVADAVVSALRLPGMALAQRLLVE
jgi:hypothetical protein